MRMPLLVALAALSLIVAACGGNGGQQQDQALEFDVSNFLVNPGATENGLIDIGGTTVEYALTIPEGFSLGDTAPVLLAFPPGDQSIDTTRNTVDTVYAQEALRLGWVVVSPSAPGGELFFSGGEEVLPGFVDWIEAWVTPEGGAPHVAGMSNGGLSSFKYAAENPTRVQSLVTFPGFAGSDDDREAVAQLVDAPIRIYVGGTDTQWLDNANTTLVALLAGGRNVQLQSFPGEGHIIASTYDGTFIFEQLESFR